MVLLMDAKHKEDIDMAERKKSFCELVDGLQSMINDTRFFGYLDKEDEHQIVQVEDDLDNLKGYCKRKYKK